MEDDDKTEEPPENQELDEEETAGGEHELREAVKPATSRKLSRSVSLSLPSRQQTRGKRRRGKGSRSRRKTMGDQEYEELSQEPGPGSGAEDEDEDAQFEKTKPLSKRLETRRKRRRTSGSKSLSAFTTLRLRLAMTRKHATDGVQKFIASFELWRDSLKEIEGTFGSAVLSYFTFLKWLWFLNIYTFIVLLCFVIIPQASFDHELPLAGNLTPIPPVVNTNPPEVAIGRAEIPRQDDESAHGDESFSNSSSGDCNLVKPNASYTDKPLDLLVGDFMQGVGWINTTLMFYGSYSRYVLVKRGGSQTFYNMPLAYFMVNCVCFLIILLSILWSASSIFEENYVRQGSKHSNTYSNKVFGGWDMCVTDEKAAKLRAQILANEIEGDLSEDFRLAALAQRSTEEKYKMYAIRLVVNLFVLVISGGAAWLIYQATQISIQASQAEQEKTVSGLEELQRVLAGYASSITLTALGVILPILFFSLSRLEDWSPRARVNVDLARTILVKLASLTLFVISLYQRINVSCMLCWENVIAAEMYKLVWMDFIVVVLFIIFVQTPRRYFADYVDCKCKLGQKIGRPLFILPLNVLELVYGQSLIWIGSWYSPFLPLMAILKLPLVFYAKKMFLMHNCRMGEKTFRAARTNYFFLLLLLGTFLMCLAAVVFGVTQIQPSVLYGPFRELNRMYDILPWTVSLLPSLLKNSFRVVGSPVFLVVLITVICLALYFFYAMSKAYRKMIAGLTEELYVEARDKKYLLKRFSGEGRMA